VLSATPLVGRTAELGALDAALETAAGGAPSAVEVIGPAGIGKSRLLAELSARADAQGYIALTGAGAEYEQDLPFWIFVDALDEYVAGVDPRRLERLDPAVRAELSQVLPSLADGGGAPAPALHERYRTHRAMRDLLEQLAATKPLVLILDDVHWADPASTDLLVALLHRPPGAGIVLTIAARPRQLPPRLATALERVHRGGLLARVQLDPLTREQARQLVGGDADALYEESGGNPFYLEQLARAPSGAPAAGAGARLGGVDVPPMVAAALAEELALLSDPPRRALDAAAVAGDPFELDLAAAAAAMPESEMLAALDDLTRIELVRATDTPRRFRFRHPIVRRAVYEATPEGWRIGAHERAAAALAERGATTTARAHHVERSARQGDLAAAAVLREAAEESLLRAPATAAQFLSGALRLLPPSATPEQRVELLLPMGQALAATGQFAASHTTLLDSLEIAPAESHALRTQLSATCARVEHLLGLHEQAHERLIRALDELPDEVSPEGVSLMVELTMDPVHRMNYDAMPRWGDRAAEAARRLDDTALSAVALAVSARAAAVAGTSPGAEARRSEAAALVDSLSDAELARRLDAAMYLAGAELYLHRFADANAHAARLLQVGRATGQGQLFPLVFSTLGITWYLMGQLREAAEPLEAAVEAARLTGNAQALAWNLYARSKVALAAGDLGLALSAAQEAVDITDDGKPSHPFGHAAFALAEANLELGKPERSVDLLERSSGGPDMPLAALSFRPFVLEVLTRCRLALGQVDRAERAAMAAVDSARTSQLPLGSAWADRAVAAIALHVGDAPSAIELALSSAAVADSVAAPIEAALSRRLAGSALAQSGDRTRAVALLEQAAAELEGCGAIRYRDAAERELRRLGQRIHRRSQPTAKDGVGVDALTTREREIAQRIVDRQTNRQIAEELYLSPRTVETHVRNIFAKLGADSRVEVARIIEQSVRAAASAPPR
jgi:ATP/maltotriose-dependent transcriptional regulator MalT